MAIPRADLSPGKPLVRKLEIGGRGWLTDGQSSMPKSKGMQIVGHSIFRDPGGVCNKCASENMVKRMVR